MSEESMAIRINRAMKEGLKDRPFPEIKYTSDIEQELREAREVIKFY
jgi:hypothetical protein